jgi:DnaJ-class molecular chaperone
MAIQDPYKVLGVEKNADEATIRTAYRKLAKTHHPDVNPGKPAAAERFKEISAAYTLLSDAEQRGRFDRGEIDASGAERAPPRGYYRDHAQQPDYGKYQTEAGIGPEDMEDNFARAFGKRGRGMNARGDDLQFTLDVDFLDAANGSTRRLTLPDGSTLDVTIPAGFKDGQVLRLKGRGGPGQGNGPKGDALIEVKVAPHKLFRREGNDIIMVLPVTLKEAVLGARIPVPTLKGTVTLTVPPNATTGTRLRLRERGIAGGHQFVELSVALPAAPEPELTAFLESWQPRNAFDPRRDMDEP